MTHASPASETAAPTRTAPLDPRDAQAVVERYRRRIEQYGPTPASLNSGSEQAQRQRHAIHAAALPSADGSLLDVGCGVGMFYEYLRQHGFAGAYTGYDIVPEYVETCRRRFGGARFELRNIVTDGIDGTYDAIVFSQVFNNRYQYGDNLRVVEHALRTAIAHARACVSIDFLSTRVDYREEHLFYYDPAGLLRLGLSLAPRVVLRHDYRPHEFCLQLLLEPDASAEDSHPRLSMGDSRPRLSCRKYRKKGRP